MGSISMSSPPAGAPGVWEEEEEEEDVAGVGTGEVLADPEAAMGKLEEGGGSSWGGWSRKL